jgi:3-deoxy-D-manno-octulosonate 8-phosphate phosphatase KdsC-like HAD superfamily phosphatase
MGVVGIPIAPADAHPEVQARSKLVLKKGGGEGVIRELADLLSGYNEKK